MKIDGKEVVLITINNPYYNFLKKDKAKKRIAINGQDAYVLNFPAMHYFVRLIANMCMSNPFNIVLVLSEKYIEGIPFVPVERRAILKDLVRNIYNMNFMMFYSAAKNDCTTDMDVINSWIARYGLGEENTNKYVKLILKYRKKTMI